MLGCILVPGVYGIPICTLIFGNYFATVPRELLEAARMDGASVLGIFRHIMLPISIPGFVVVMIWQFTSIWNEFLFAVTIAQDPTRGPLPWGWRTLPGGPRSQSQGRMRGRFLAPPPPL